MEGSARTDAVIKNSSKPVCKNLVVLATILSPLLLSGTDCWRCFAKGETGYNVFWLYNYPEHWKYYSDTTCYSSYFCRAGVSIECFCMKKWNEKWRFGAGYYLQMFLLYLTHPKVYEYFFILPEWAGLNFGIGYFINKRTLLLIKQGFGLGGFCLVSLLDSHTSISVFPRYPEPVEIFVECFYQYITYSGGAIYNISVTNIYGGIRVCFGKWWQK